MSTNDSQDSIEELEHPDDPFRVSLMDYVGVIFLVGVVVVVVLALLGPAVGNAFSSITECYAKPMHHWVYVWLDENGNGIRDEGEEPLSGVNVTNTRYGSTHSSNSNGVVDFGSSIPCGENVPEFYAEVPAGYRLTTEPRVQGGSGRDILFGFIRDDLTGASPDSDWCGTDNDASTESSNTVTMPAYDHSAGVVYEHLVGTTIFEDDFSTDKAWVDESGGDMYRDATNQWLVWQTRRDTTRRYYYPIPDVSVNSPISLSFKVNITASGGKGGLLFGLAESLNGAYNRTSFPTGFFLNTSHDTLGIDLIHPYVTYSDRNMYGGWSSSDSSTYINLSGINVWRDIQLSLNGLSWVIREYDLSGNFLDELSGTLPAIHSAYRYVIVFYDAIGGWKWQHGYLDDIELEVYSQSPPSTIIEEFDSSAGFVRTSPGVTISGGKVNWSVSRNPAGYQQYVYRSIPEFTGDVRLTVRGQVNTATNNCNVNAGIGTQPGNGLAVNFGYFGGGCPTRGPVINGKGVILDSTESPPGCIFTGNWLWVNFGTQYTAVMNIIGCNASLTVDGVGTATGTAQYTGPYNTLYVGLTGDGDWPSCTGIIETIIVEPLGEDHTPPTPIQD